MPDDVLDTLRLSNAHELCLERPSYQQNDYLMWIANAKTAPTRQKRIDQTVAELLQSGAYMKMEHRPSRRSTADK